MIPGSSVRELVARLVVIPLIGTIAVDALDVDNLLSGLGPAPAGDPRFTDFQPPGPGDVRSPCPGLNTLANHGFIHHDGRNMTIPHLIDGLAAGLNIGAELTTVLGAVGLLASPNPFGGAFDLDQLDQHNFPIEHDTSLSRQDAYFGDDHSFYGPNWQQVLDHYEGASETSITAASNAKLARVKDSLARNPQVVYSFREFIISYGETAFYLQTMSDPVSGVANLDFVKSLFEEEKLPYELGWRPSSVPITLASLGAMVVELYGVNNEAIPEGGIVVADSYQDALELIVGGVEVLANLTEGISSAFGL
uniref:Heme-thiolate peroxidase HTP7 n=1 Tax=Leptoxyphium fumago TaxID=5474 RepID=A0A1B2IM18_LEPFU|nr:heme-thiolate peroxidase HTP7 [Leptoxyphium fumago]